MNRCEWANSSKIMQDYHDIEWGVPVHEDNLLFEFLCLEGAQAGLSWSTILRRRETYRKVFDNFNPKKISKYTEKKIEVLMNNKGIIRNRKKIESVISNAKAFREIQKEFGSFDNYIWGWVNHKIIHNNWKSLKEIPAITEISKNMSKELKKYGFTFVGPTICYAFMQAIGMVNDHILKCFRHKEIQSFE